VRNLRRVISSLRDASGVMDRMRVSSRLAN
jgi:hypothetical protein